MFDPFLHFFTAIGLFAGTNIDDLVVLTVLFLALRAKGKPRAQAIVLGQYIGIGTLVAISVPAAFGLGFVPERWVGLLGLVPILFGVIGLVRAYKDRNESQSKAPLGAAGILGIAGITIANGADNISVYTPLFHGLGLGGIIITVVVFALLTAVWCVIASLLGSHRQLVATIDRFGHWIVPIVFILVGMSILAQSGVIARLLF